jgi:hypothetical protein
MFANKRSVVLSRLINLGSHEALKDPTSLLFLNKTVVSDVTADWVKLKLHKNK